MTDRRVKLLSALDAVDRRIDNMRFLVRFQEEKRGRIIDDLRETIGRRHPRLRSLEGGHVPQEEGPLQQVRVLAAPDGSRVAVHQHDVALLDMGVLTPPDGYSDGGWADIGHGCAWRMGREWHRVATPKSNS